MSMCRVFSCVGKRVFVMTSVFSWQNSISLYPVSFRIPRPNLPVTPGVSRLPTFAFQSKSHISETKGSEDVKTECSVVLLTFQQIQLKNELKLRTALELKEYIF